MGAAQEAASAQRRRERRARSEAAARGQQQLWHDFFLFFQRATLSGGEPTVLAVPITIELDQTILKTGGDVFLESAVKGVNGVVIGES